MCVRAVGDEDFVYRHWLKEFCKLISHSYRLFAKWQSMGDFFVFIMFVRPHPANLMWIHYAESVKLFWLILLLLFWVSHWRHWCGWFFFSFCRFEIIAYDVDDNSVMGCDIYFVNWSRSELIKLLKFKIKLILHQRGAVWWAFN